MFLENLLTCSKTRAVFEVECHSVVDFKKRIGALPYIWPPPAAMEHGKAPGRPQALLKKDSESDKKNGAWGIRARVSVSLSAFLSCGKT